MKLYESQCSIQMMLMYEIKVVMGHYWKINCSHFNQTFEKESNLKKKSRGVCSISCKEKTMLQVFDILVV